MNILLFLQRHAILTLDAASGKKFEWDDKKVQQAIEEDTPNASKRLSKNQAQAHKLLQKFKEGGYKKQPDQTGSIPSNL